MECKTKHTRLLVYLIYTIKEREFEFYSKEVVRLKKLKTQNPDIKFYAYKYEIALNRLEQLQITSKELKRLEFELLNNF